MTRRWWIEGCLPLLGYLLVALVLTAPVGGQLSSHFIGGKTGDAYEIAHHVWWYKTALQQGRNIFVHEMLGHPDGFPSILLWAHPLQFFPMWLFALVLPLAVAYNLGMILTLGLNGLAMYGLARSRLHMPERAPALLAGLVFMLFPIMQGHLFDGHAGLIVQWTLPLFIWALYRFAEAGGKRRYLLALACFVLGALGYSLQLINALLPFCALFFIARWLRRDQVGALRLVAVALPGCLLLLLYLVPVLGNTLQDGHYSGVGGHVRYSVDLLGIVSPSFANPFWQDIALHSRRVLGTNLGEGASYVGVVGSLLALLGIGARREGRWWLLVALVAWVLALGPVLKVYNEVVVAHIVGYETVMPLPFALVANLPIFEFARSPGRFMFLFAAAFALMAGYGAAALWSSGFMQRRGPRLQMLLGLVLALLLFEDYRLFGAFPSVPAEAPAAIQALSQRRDIRAIYNAPYDNLLAVKEAMFLQTVHGKPLIGGHDTRISPVDPARLELLSSFHPVLLNDADVDVIIIHKVHSEPAQRAELLGRAQQWLGEPIYEDQRYAIYETPFAPERPQTLGRTRHEEGETLSYLYKDEPGWLEMSATLEAENRQVDIALNGRQLDTVQVNGWIPYTIALPLARSGYYSLRFAVNPPCPAHINNELLRCQGLTVANIDTVVLTNGAIYDPIRLADGIELAGHYLPKQFDEQLALRLWWRFESERNANDVRFLHILDQRGLPVSDRPSDLPFGQMPAGSERVETVMIDTSLLPPGEYQVLTGWYVLPLAIRYDVLSDVAGAQNDTVVLGSFRVRG